MSQMETMSSVGALQELLAMMPEKQHLKPERIQQQLARLLGWEEQADTQGLHRMRGFASPAEAQVYADFAVKLAARRRQRVAVSLEGRQVVVTLKGRPGRGNTAGFLTDAVYDLACVLG